MFDWEVTYLVEGALQKKMIESIDFKAIPLWLETLGIIEDEIISISKYAQPE